MPQKKKKDSEVTKAKPKKRGRPRKTEEIKEKREPVIEKQKVEKKIEIKEQKKEFFYAVGRRKSAVARIRYYQEGEGEIIINDKDYRKYFPYFEFQKIILGPFVLTNYQTKGKFLIKVKGGGKRGQAESVRHGLSRLLVKLSKDNRHILKKAGFLRRDARVKERKKYGLKRARRAPQWQKR